MPRQAELTDAQRAQAAQRWLARYRAGGLTALARRPRADRGTRRLPAELVRGIGFRSLRQPIDVSPRWSPALYLVRSRTGAGRT